MSFAIISLTIVGAGIINCFCFYLGFRYGKRNNVIVEKHYHNVTEKQTTGKHKGFKPGEQAKEPTVKKYSLT